jgi:hypothetical protein
LKNGSTKKGGIQIGQGGIGFPPNKPADNDKLKRFRYAARRRIKNVMLNVLATIVNGPRVATSKSWRRKAFVGITNG